jgi:large conductance mechanosensitive channel
MPEVKADAVWGEAKKDVGGFKKFLLRGNVVDLAVGVIIGAAFGDVVKALVKDIFQPLIQAFGGQPNAEGLTFTVGRATFQVGDLINALISFLLIALVVYFFVVLPVNKLMDKYKPQPQPAPTKDCPECTNKIPKAARRCPECAAQLMPPSDEVAEAMRQVGAPSGAQIADHAAKALASRLTGEDGSSAR